MPELERKTILLKIYYQCDGCHKGYLMFTGRIRKGIDKKFFYHKCSNCKEVFELAKQYPAIKFEDEDTIFEGLNN